jgi:phosphoglycerate dehydrogenase-like enzyme
VDGSVSEEDKDRIRAVPGVAVTFFDDRASLEERIAEADAVAGAIGPEALTRAKDLKWVQSWAAGPDSALYPEMVDSPVTLTSAKGNGAIPLAEHAIWLMLTLNRNATRWLDAQRDHRWDRFTHGELNGATCGIIGLGYSGLDLALKAKAFHMHVLGVRRRPQPSPNVDEVFGPDGLHELLTRSDFVVVTAPFTSETAALLGEAEFRAMKPSAYFVVFSRGGIADEDALLQALREGWIAGAGLDSFELEPLPADSPFWEAPNVICTPHNGATTAATKRRGADIFVENLQRFSEGRTLFNIVDKQLGY